MVLRRWGVSRSALRRILSDEGLTLATSAFESLYAGQFTLSTQLIKPNYLNRQAGRNKDKKRVNKYE